MPKHKTAKIEANADTTAIRRSISANSAQIFNELFMRSVNGGRGLNRKNIETACGYETVLCFQDFYDLWDKGDVAKRIVEAYPEYTWSQNPEVYEVESEKVTTKFEEDWKEHVKKTRPFAHLRNLDIMAGIGKFGIMVIGVDDGGEMNEPLDPIPATADTRRQVMYHRTYTEGEVKIKTWDADVTSSRYGQPIMYTVTPGKFSDSSQTISNPLPVPKKEETNEDPFVKEFDVHYTRVIHFADNATCGPVYGRERLRQVFNRMTDIMKIVGGSAEMFWQGGFSGIAFEMDADAEVSNAAKQTMKEDIDNYVNKLQRTLLLQGVKANPMSPTIASPIDHLDVQITLISIGTSIPKRILSGSEMGKLASTQDSANWGVQVQTRRTNVAGPFLLLPYVDFCVRNGIVRSPKQGNEVQLLWHPITNPSVEERSRSAEYFTTALETYCGKALYHAIDFQDYLYHIHGYTSEEAKELAKSFNKEAFEKIRKESLESKKATSEDTKTASSKVKSKRKEGTVTEG